MKKILFLSMTALFMSFSSAQVTKYSVGDTVDNFTVVDTHGVSHTLYDITASGKYVFLDFFFRNCGPCQQTSRYFYQLYETYGENQEHTYMMSLSPIDDNATITEFENLYNGGFTPPPGAGTEGGAPPVTVNFGINAYPTYCIISPDNKLVVGDIWPVSGMGSFEAHFPQELWDLINGVMGTSDIDIQKSFSVYPTVSNGQFTVQLDKTGQSTVSVYDMTGKNVYSGDFSNKEINMNLKLADGVYIIRVVNEGKASSQKLIIKN